MKKIFFAYPKTYWNSETEQILIKRIEDCFPDFEVEIPNKPVHDENYKKWKREFGNGERYYSEEVLPWMGAGIFLAFPDGMFGAGAYGEAEFLDMIKKPIYEIKINGIITKLNLIPTRMLSIQQTRERYQ